MIIKFWKRVFCYAWTPLCIGGSSESSSDTSTTNNTSNTAYNTDRRAVASEEAISVTGDGNVVSRNTANSTTFTDTSNRSSSTSFVDNSDRSVTHVTTDFGSVSAALDGMGKVADRAVDTSQLAINGAITSLDRTGANSLALAMRAFDMASAQGANAITNTNAALGFAERAIGESRAAFAEAKDGGQNKTLLLAAAAVIGAVGLAAAMR